MSKKLSKSCLEDSPLFNNSGEKRSKRYRTGVLNFWDFEHLATVQNGNETLPAVVRDIPENGSFVILSHKQEAYETLPRKSTLQNTSKHVGTKEILKKVTPINHSKENGMEYSGNTVTSCIDDQSGQNDTFIKPQKKLKKSPKFTSIGKKKNLSEFSKSVTLTIEDNSAHSKACMPSNKKSTLSKSLSENSRHRRVLGGNKDEQSLNLVNSNCSISSKCEESSVLNQSPPCLKRKLTRSSAQRSPSKSVNEISNDNNSDSEISSVFKKPLIFKTQKHSVKSSRAISSSEFDRNKISMKEMVRPEKLKNEKLMSDSINNKAKNSPQSQSKILEMTKVNDITSEKIKDSCSETQLLNDPNKSSHLNLEERCSSNSSEEVSKFNGNTSISSSDIGYSSCSENIKKNDPKQYPCSSEEIICHKDSESDSTDKLSGEFSEQDNNSDCPKTSTDRSSAKSSYNKNNLILSNEKSNESYNLMCQNDKEVCEYQSSREFNKGQPNQLSANEDESIQKSTGQSVQDKVEDNDLMKGEDLKFSEVSDASCTYRIARGVTCDGLTPYMVSLLEGTLVFQTPSQATVVVIEGRGTLEQLSQDKTVCGVTITLHRAAQFQAIAGSILSLCKDGSSPQLNMCIILDEE